MEPSDRKERLLNQLDTAQTDEQLNLIQRKLEMLKEAEK